MILPEPTAAVTLDDTQTMVLDAAAAFCRTESPIASVRALLQSAQGDYSSGYSDSVWQQCVEQGWPASMICESNGGADLGLGSAVCISEALGKHLLAVPLISSWLAAIVIEACASATQRGSWLADLVGGDVATVALLDNEDWGASCTALTAVEDDGQWSLRGTKRFVCDASVASAFVVAVTCFFADGRREPAWVYVHAAALGDDAIRPSVLVDETKRAANVCFDDVTLDAHAFMRSGAFDDALQRLKGAGALLHAAETTGASSSTLRCMLSYINTRVQFGRLIGANQALKHPAVDALNAINAARSLVYHAASVFAAEGFSSQFYQACRMAKVQADDALVFTADRTVQFHGGMGFTYDCDAQLYIRRAQWARQVYGDAMHHRQRLAASLFDS